MRPLRVVVRDVLLDQIVEVPLPADDEVIRALWLQRNPQRSPAVRGTALRRLNVRLTSSTVPTAGSVQREKMASPASSA